MVGRCWPHRLVTERKWRALVMHQSTRREHYTIHDPGPHVILFHRLRTDVPMASENEPSEPNSMDA
ncbi:Cyclin-dependent kinase regulatory subunit [Taenia solium]|eukprot:TsM_000434500 transcript=TsM_000434500 gene=TsM_000434500